MNKFLDLLRESVIVQGTVTLALVGTICYLALAGRDVPEYVVAASGLALGYFFGSKTQQRIERAQRE